MRLIDADQFGVVSLQGKSEDFIGGVKYILEKIDEAPTLPNPCGKPCAFVRPNGEWKEKPEPLSMATKICTACGDRGAVGTFCMWCGAYMMKEGDI